GVGRDGAAVDGRERGRLEAPQALLLRRGYGRRTRRGGRFGRPPLRTQPREGVLGGRCRPFRARVRNGPHAESVPGLQRPNQVPAAARASPGAGSWLHRAGTVTSTLR